ncbi:ATP-binding protein [Jatrophihabitans fulvus]
MIEQQLRPLRLTAIADSHVFAVEIPWLPSIESPGDAATAQLREAFGRQVAMLRALAESGQHHPGALQLRIVVDEQVQNGRSSSVLRVFILGSARRREEASALHSRLIATLPSDLPTDVVDDITLGWLVDVDDRVRWGANQVAEIRRAIESSDPENDAGEVDPQSPVLLRWTWTSVNLIASLGALHKLPRGAQLVVHLEPRAVSRDALGFLREEISDLRESYQDNKGENPLLAAVIGGYMQALRDLPRACFHVRVMVVCPGFAIPDGLPEIVGADLTRSWETGSPVGTFDVIRPGTAAELDNALALVQLLRSQPVRSPDQPELAELLHLFDPHEASAAFRIPVPGPEGLPGLRTEPASSLPRGLVSVVVAERPSVLLGTGPSGDLVTLSHDELNRHALVAGLPGFGKTTTVQALLLQLWPADSSAKRIPFLVLDPAKTDYRSLAETIGPDCRLIELTGDDVAFNPLCIPDGVPRTVFATRLAAAFDAAYDLSSFYPIAGTVLTRAVHRALREERPTMARLYAHVRHLISESAYSERVKGDLEGALTSRLELLTDGSLGSALMGDGDAAIDWGDLLSRPAVVLVREFAGPRERALLMSLLLAGLVSYREYHSSEGLGHVTVVEEAHRILAGGGQSGYVNDGAQVFVDAMAELRGAGEGFVVVEQAPSRLVPEVRKLVGTVLAHRTVDAEERAVLATSLTLPTDEHALARLEPGHAVVLAADMLAPAVVKVERVVRADRTGAPTVSTRIATRTAEAPVRLWCQQCPYACNGFRGAQLVESRERERGTRTTESWTASFRDAQTHALSRAELYCAAAYADAQRSVDERDWNLRRALLLSQFKSRRTERSSDD